MQASDSKPSCGAPPPERSNGVVSHVQAAPESGVRKYRQDDLRRGVPVSKLFARSGRVLRTRPEKLSAAQLKKLHSASHRVDQFDCFISHVCNTPGLKKYLTLMVDFLGLPAFAAACVVSFGLFAFQVWCQELPRIGPATRLSLWEVVGGLIAAAAVCTVGHVLCRRTHCFLDCTSICQDDPELKAAGIRNIPAHIRASRELLVLWDERYFTRMWCVYEMAVATVEDIPMRILPIDVYASFAVWQLVWCVCNVGHFCYIAFVCGWDFGSFHSLFATVPLCALQAYAGRGIASMYANLHSQFETFDVRSAAISVESDRRLIFDGIGEMFDGSLDNFNDTVRTTIKSAAMRSLTGQRAKLPYWAMLWQGLFDMPSFFSEWTSTELIKDNPCTLVAKCVFGVTHAFCIGPLLYAAAMELGSRWARGVRPGSAWSLLTDLVVGVLIAALSVAWERLGDLLQDLGKAEEWQAMFANILVNGLAWIATLWAFRPHGQGQGARRARKDCGCFMDSWATLSHRTTESHANTNAEVEHGEF